tara:strand:- start:3255 stop:3539 length:285 start_codon:yes stop_codon:yes gene_type:complete
MTKNTEFRPYGNWLVLPDPTTKETESGLILDDSTAKKMATNVLEVLAAGPLCQMAKVGDIVLVNPMSEAMRMTINEKPCILINEHNILGTFDKN